MQAHQTSLAKSSVARRPAAMTKHTPVTAAAVVHTSRGPPEVRKVKALAFKRTPGESRKEQSDQVKLCMFENGPFFIFQPWCILQGWNLIRDNFRDQGVGLANKLKEQMLLDEYPAFVPLALPCALLQDVRLLTRWNHDFAEFRRVSPSSYGITSVLLRFSAQLNVAPWEL